MLVGLGTFTVIWIGAWALLHWWFPSKSQDQQFKIVMFALAIAFALTVVLNWIYNAYLGRGSS